MPLYIQERPVDVSVLADYNLFIKKYGDVFKEKCECLQNLGVRKVDKNDKCLYIGQREIGSTGVFDNNIKMLGTDMMTTCHAAVLRCPISSATSLAHFDGSCTESGIMEMAVAVHEISLVTNPELVNCGERKFQLHLAGGFDDDRQLSHDLSTALLNGFHNVQTSFAGKLEIHLQTFCCTLFNTIIKCESDLLVDSPIVFGLGVDILNGNCFPLEFCEDSRGPGGILRGVRTFSGHGKMVNMYRWHNQCIVIEPFSYKPFRNAAEWLVQPDEIIKEYMSTSPEVEPDNFVAHVRQSISFMLHNPDPMESVFKHGKPILYKLNNNTWDKVES